MPTHAQLEADLRALEEHLPVQGSADPAAFDYPAFQARVAELISVAAPQDQAFIRQRAEHMLRAAGLAAPGGQGQGRP